MMYDKERAKLRSHLFDKELIESGNWKEEWKNDFESWNEEYNILFQKQKSLLIMKNMIVELLGDECDPSGKVKIDRLGNMLDKLEQILISSKTLDNKYYRDHLNHSIRVVLLSKLMVNYEPFKFSEEDTNYLILSSIFHDISYPLSQVHKIINSTINSIKRGYNIARNIKEIKGTEFTIDDDMLEYIFGNKKNEVIKNIHNYDHGILSALEFITYLKSNDETLNKYKKVIQDIAFHTNQYKYKINEIDEKSLTILILSDEIQDWGRPNNFNQIPISKIDPFEISNNLIKCNYVIENPFNYSLLRQLYGKLSNMSRLNLNVNHFIQLSYPFSNYVEISCKELIDELKILYDEVIKKEDIFNHVKNEYFYRNELDAEEILYGFNIHSHYKYRLLKSLNTNKEKLSLYDKKIILNILGNEILIIDEFVDIINSILIENEGGRLILKIKDISGLLYGINDKLESDIIYEIATIIRYINAIIMKLINYAEDEFPYYLGIEKYPNEIDIKKLREEYNTNLNYLYLKNVMEAIATNGAYVFHSV